MTHARFACVIYFRVSASAGKKHNILLKNQYPVPPI